MNLTQNDVSTLASIIQKETAQKIELKRIAGVYVNRLQHRMRLQADPTIRHLAGDTIRSVLNKHLAIQSPYNTYIHYGLPPGPICAPSIDAIDAVLNHEEYNYFYFCAKPDFSGYHNFSRTLGEHNRNARLYRQTLNKRKIWR